MARENSARRSRCPLNTALEAFGDAWSLLIVRDLMFRRRTSFKEFLDSEEGIATNILADRLRRLEVGGIIERERDPSDARRQVYRLTEKGVDLAAVLVEMVLWADRYYQTDAPPSVVREMARHRRRFIAAIRRQWRTAKKRA